MLQLGEQLPTRVFFFFFLMELSQDGVVPLSLRPEMFILTSKLDVGFPPGPGFLGNMQIIVLDITNGSHKVPGGGDSDVCMC